MLNKAILIGRLTRDPELRSTSNNISVTSFTIAVDRNFTNQQGERETDFIPVVAWRSLAETCARYLTKGRLVAVSGRMQVRSYEGNDGLKRYITEVVADEVQFLERNPNSGGAPGNAPIPGSGNSKPTGNGASEPDGFSPLDVDDDELPF
ncbi:single-stranded DNA-binding protein [Eubacteriales bacterium mix99]|jgi:single-strand DNA-binding protein|nr:single-stranded DNA-binding protein [Clostridiales bacterium]